MTSVRRYSKKWKNFSTLFLLFLLMISIYQLTILTQKYREIKNTLVINQIHKTEKPKVTLVVGILSKLSAISRRDSIRLTWLKTCKEQETNVFCRFFTDSPKDLNSTTRSIYDEEDATHKDLSYMPYKGGHNFALRLVWMLQWYLKHFDFDYFLRVDDDYFLCLDRLLLELPHRPSKGLYWGYIHCTEHVIRVDEGWMILSRDIIDESINKLNTTLPCHPFGDQAVALWVKESKINITYFSDNERVVHWATAYHSKNFTGGDICVKHIGLHGSYPLQMLKYWILSQDYKFKKNIKEYEIPVIKPFSQVCKFKKEFDLRYFWPHVRFTPKLCKDNPTWGVTNEVFKGREYLGEEAIF